MHSTCPLPIVTRNNGTPPSARLWLGALLLSLLWCGLALATDAPPIPLAELGQRADTQQPAPVPVLTAGRATLTAPLQALRGEIGPAGLTVESTSVSEGGGRFRLTPTNLSKGAAAVPLASGVVSVRDRAVILDRGPLTEVLTASGDGLRQDFVVAQPPAGDAPLTLTLALEGATAQDADAGVSLTLPDGRALVYHRLHITDAAGQVLDGTLAVADAQTLTITVADAAARYPLTIDPTISDADWQVWNPSVPGANNPVNVIAYDSAHNRLYVGGLFTAINTVAANRIAQWDGSTWSALGSGLDGEIGEVKALAVSGSNLYVGGVFTNVGGITANRIAKWDTTKTDNTGWSALGSGVGVSGSGVVALAVLGTDLYVGGQFIIAGDVTGRNYIAKLDTTKTDDTDNTRWSALGNGLDSSVNALAVSGTDLYVGGRFTTAGGSAANRIAKWAGGTWSALGTGVAGGLGVVGVVTVDALAVSGSNLYVGGNFNTAGGVTGRNYIAKWDGSAWAALGSGLNYKVNALAMSGSDLYVGGQFQTAGGSTVNYIAKWNGSTWSALGSGTNVIVYALAVVDGKLYAGGVFTAAGGSTANYIAKWDITNTGWSAFGSGLSGKISALAVSGTDIYIGGAFTTAGGITANRIAKWDGSAWAALGSGLNNTVNALAVSGSDLYVGGQFTTAGGSAANRIAKWAGGTWSALGTGLNNTVNALAVSGSNLYVGGNFTNAGGVTGRNYIAKWDMTQTGDTGWSALDSGVAGTAPVAVNALAVSSSGLYVGGQFTTAGGSAANYIAKWDGSAWSALGSGLTGYVYALAGSSSDLYVGGDFTTAGGISAARIAKWDTAKIDNTGWSALGDGLSGAVRTLAVSGSDLYAGGDFTTAGGISAARIAKWDTAKTDNTGWSALGSGLDNQVAALAISGTKLYVGGSFVTAGGKFSPYAAFVNLPSSGPTATTGAASGITATSATLNGTVNDNGIVVSAIAFEYGLTTGYGSSVAAAPSSLAIGAGSTAVSASLTGLGGCNTGYHFRVNATHAGGTVNGSDATFATSACTTGPTATTSAASAVTGTGATLNGSVTDVGLNVSNIQFQYGTATGVYGTPVAASITTITATPGTPQTITPTATLTGLTCNTTYYYRITATDTTRTNNGTELTFTTSACTTGPTVTTSAATAVTGTGATLNGSVTDVGQNVTGISFEYGLTTIYGTTGTASVTGITATPGAPQTVNPTASITGLTCGGTTYHFRLRATDGSATNNGAAQSFTTSSCNAAPVASNVQISGTASAGQTLTGSYTYSDADSDPESGSTFRWLSNGSNTTTGATAISGATGTTYAITPADRGKYLFYCVTPRAAGGTNPGAEACSAGTQIANSAVTWTVTTTADPGTVGGCVSDPATECSLRDAIASASMTVADTIVFDTSLVGATINLGSTMPFSTGSSTKSVTIDGTGSNITVKGTMSTTSGNFVVFNVTSGNTVAMKNFTIADSGGAPYWDGGGIRNAGTLTLQGMTLSNHKAYFSSGGGLVNLGPGTATVIDSTFLDNKAGSGGAIANSNATLTVINSTFSGNVADNEYGASQGGAIYNQQGTVTLINNTIVNNQAARSGVGGGIYNASGQTMTLVNNLLANNVTGVTGSTVANQNCAGTLTDNGHNLDSGTTCAFGAGSLSSRTDALVGPLGYYGSNGGTAQTIPLLPGSAAIDAGDAAVCANASTVNNLDQRGITRPQGTVCDIGAFESQGFTLTPVTGSTPQSATVSTAFANALGVTVASVSTKPAEPVDGGVITFTPPGSGASATLATPNPVTIDCPAPESAGFNVQGAPPVDSCTASLTATANATTGGYSVTAGARGAATNATFSLTNTSQPPQPINGVCGSANGQTFTSAPTTNLCSVGSPSEVTSNPGTFTWSCAGSNGGQDASCSATRASTATVTPATQTVSGAVGTAITNTTPYTPIGFTGTVTYAISPTLPTGLTLNSASGVISGTPTASQATATFTVTATGATSGTATATVSITILATQATGTTPGGPVTARITGGTCLGYEAGSARFTVPANPPVGETFPYGVFGFTVLSCGTGGRVTITLTYPAALPAGTKYWKNIGGNWEDWTNQVTIAGNTVVLTITDGGAGDTNPNPGQISDPSGPAFAGGPTSIPTLSEWGLILLGLSLLAVVGWRQRQGYSQRG